MKNLFLTAMLFIISSICLSAQSREPAQVPLRYLPNQQPTYFSSTDSNFKRPEGIVVGFHWDNNASAARCIYANQNNVKTEQLFYVNGNNDTIITIDQVQKDASLMIQGSYPEGTVYSHCYGDNGILNARSMKFETTLLINQGDNQRDIISKRPFDVSNPVFGFEYIRGLVPSSEPNYSFLRIDSTSLIDQVVFKTPWASDQLTRHATETWTADTNKIA